MQKIRSLALLAFLGGLRILSAEPHSAQQYSMPLTDNVAQALEEFTKQEDVSLSELLGAVGVSVETGSVVIFDTPGDGWRIELTTSHANGIVFLSALHKITFEDEGAKSRGKSSVLAVLKNALSASGVREQIEKNRILDLKVKEFLKEVE